MRANQSTVPLLPWDVDQMPDPVIDARDRGLAAATRAAERAERAEEGWTEAACAHVMRFARMQAGPWLLENARRDAEALGLAAPPDKRAWGAVIQTLRRRGRIRMAGYAAAESSNGSPKCLWEA